MAVPRRRMNTYGKQSKKVLIHDLFDVAAPSTYAPARAGLLEQVAPERTLTPGSQISDDPETSFQLQRELLAAMESTDAPFSSQQISVSRSPSVGPASVSALFDVPSSDDDVLKSKLSRPTYKRRKITPTNSDVEAGFCAVAGSANESPGKGRGRNVVRTSTSTHDHDTLFSNDDTRLSGHVTKPNQTRTEKPLKKAPLAQSPSRQKRDIHSHSPQRQDPQSTYSPPSSPALPSTPVIGSPLSDRSSASMVSSQSVKRKRRGAEDIASGFSSPSRLPISGLKLNSKKHTTSEAASLGREESATSGVGTPSKRRLIDRLDAPKSEGDVKNVELNAAQPLSQPSEPQRRRPNPNQIPATVEVVNAHKESSANHDFQMINPVNDTVRPRKYGKQRSNLQSMVTKSRDDRPESRNSVQQLQSQIEALTQSQTSNMDFDLEDDEPSSQIKSIHELRQAGVLDRFDRDFDQILEDVESSTKAVRIQGLMSLTRKLQEQAFKRRMLESGMLVRLLIPINADMDATSCVLFVVCLWTTVNSDAVTPKIISQIHAALLKLPANIVCERRPLSKIVRDRNENLSKAISRDLLEFETYVMDQSASSGRNSKQIIPSTIAIRCLDFVSSKVDNTNLPPRWIEAILDAITYHAGRISTNDTPSEHLESMRLLAGWLERSNRHSSRIDSSTNPKKLADFANVMAELPIWSSSQLSQAQGICLRLIAELCSGDDGVTGLFAESELPSQAVKIVIRHFPRIGVVYKDSPQIQIEGETLIGAFACLLNFAEQAPDFKAKLLTVGTDGRCQLDDMVGFFTQYVHHVEEVTEVIPNKDLLPFGFLLLVLSLLCSDIKIYRHLHATVGPKGINRLFSQAAIFLQSLGQIGEGKLEERFGPMLARIVEQRLAD